MILRHKEASRVQCMPGTLSRQLVVYRQRVAAAPVLLECETLSRDHVTQVVQASKVKVRERLFPPYVTLWTFLLQVLSPDGSCRDAVTRLRAFQVAQGSQPCRPTPAVIAKPVGGLPEEMVARLAQASRTAAQSGRPRPLAVEGTDRQARRRVNSLHA